MDTKAKAPQERMKDPAVVIPEAMEPVGALYAAVHTGGVPKRTLDLVHLRASQINGCSSCGQSASRGAKKAGETDNRLYAVVAWRESPHFTDPERAALALAEAVTVSAIARTLFPTKSGTRPPGTMTSGGLSALVLMIAVTNVFNRLNVATRQIAGAWGWTGDRR